jgi:hypothetical protein
MSRSHSQKLRTALAQGRTVVCVVGGLNQKVLYRPRWDTDRTPWILAAYAEQSAHSDLFRYSGAQCAVLEPKLDSDEEQQKLDEEYDRVQHPYSAPEE